MAAMLARCSAARGRLSAFPTPAAAATAACRGRRQRVQAAAASPSAPDPQPAPRQPLQAVQEAVFNLHGLARKSRINRQQLLQEVDRLEGWVAAVERDLKVAERDLKVAERDVKVAELLKQAIVVECLHTFGAFDARGLLELFEKELPAFDSLKKPLSRQDKWKKLGMMCPDVEACILAANPAWKKRIPDKAEALYGALSGRVHADTSNLAAVQLVEGPLSQEDMHFLKCLADHLGCPVELRYRQVAEAAMLDKQPAADAVGE